MSQSLVDKPSCAPDSREFLADLSARIARHPALEHRFLSRFAEAPLSREQLTVFAAQHYLYSRRFAQNLAAAISNVPDEGARTLLIMNMYEEIGEPGRIHDRLPVMLLQAGMLTAGDVGLAYAEAARGARSGDIVEVLIEHGAVTRDQVEMVREMEAAQVRELAHPALFRRFLKALGLTADNLACVTPIAETTHFIDEMASVCRKGLWLEAMGALGPGTECVVPSLYKPLHRGVERSGLVKAQDYVFWTLHIRCDEEHGDNIVKAIAPYASDKRNQDLIRRGAFRVLDARRAWFDGLYRLVFDEPSKAMDEDTW